MAIVTYLPRMLPLVVLSRLNMPAWFIRWLSFVPVAVLSALLAPALLIQTGDGGRALWLAWDNRPLLASLPTFAVAMRTRNLFAAVLTGLGSIFVLNYLL